MVGVMAVMVTSSKGLSPGLLCSVPLTPRQPLSTHNSSRDSWTLAGKSGSVSSRVTAPFFWVLGHTRFRFCPPRVGFSSPVEILSSNLTDLQSQIPWGLSVPIPDSHIVKSFVDPGTFAIVQELLWKNCSPVCGLSAQWLYGGLTCCASQVCCSQRSCPLSRPLLSVPPQETLKHSEAGLAESLWGPWVLVHTRICLSPPSSLAGMGFVSKCDFAPPTNLLEFLLCPWTWGIFFFFFGEI